MERAAYAMGTSLRMRIGAVDRPAAIQASERAVRAIEEWEAVLSTWRPGTALADLNAAPPRRAVGVPRRLLDLLDEVAAWSRRTGGAFDPAVGPLLDVWDLRGSGRRPGPAEIERALASTGLRCFAFDPTAGRARRLCEGAWLDAGAFGKGAALRAARAALEAAGARSALIDFGGQEVAFGAPPDATGWPIAVAHPSRRREIAVHLRIAGGSAATTGQSERGVETPGGPVGHVLDPRSGRPVPPWGSVTVVSDDPLVADVLSTALFVMGPAAGTEWLERRSEVAALFLVDSGHGISIRATAAMELLLVTGFDPHGTGDRR